MNTMMESLASPGWSEVVQALLHTFWEGAIIAAVLFLVLRHTVNPVTRHRWCLAALAAVMLAGLCTWSVLDSRRTMHPPAAVPVASVVTPTPRTESPANAVGANVTLTPMEVGKSGTTRTAPPGQPAPPDRKWVAWVALVWLVGAALMLARAARSLAGAEKLCRTARPLEDEAMLRLIEEARRKLGLARRIRAVVTEKLTSPAVAGILVPTLIMPLSLMTTMPPNQLQLVILHELAHIRRGDYLANLFQLLAESLLFFNPAVWWISRQLRHEREACCDAVAIALAGGERLEYARALARVAEHSLEENLAATPAFANGKDRPGLKDRVRRVLAPGARPHLRLTWRALTGSLVFGGAVFLLSALGTQWTVQAAARLLTPQERIDRIETEMKDIGQPPDSFASNPTNQAELTIQVRTDDGSPLPRLRSLYSDIQTGNSGGGGPLLLNSNGMGKVVLQGKSTAYLGTWIKGYAPARVGPLTASSTNATGHFDLILDHGFGISIEVLDQDSGKPVPRAKISYLFAFLGPNMYMDLPHPATTDDDGIVHLTNCASFPLHMHVAMDGYEPGEVVFDHLKADDELKLYTRRARPMAGQVTDAASGQPIGGASIYVIHATDAPGVGDINPWGIQRWANEKPNAVADADGHFTIDRLPQSGHYLLMAQAPGHASVMLYDARPGQTNLSAALGPEIVVRGRIEGNLNMITDGQGHAAIAPEFLSDRPDTGIQGTMARNSSSSPQHGPGFRDFANVRIENGAGYFEFTNLTAGQVRVYAGGLQFTTNATASLNNWLIQLPGAGPVGKGEREIVLRFVNSAGVAPQGTVSLRPQWPASPGRPAQMPAEYTMTNGEVHYTGMVGHDLSVAPGHTVGFWFASQSVPITEGSGAQTVAISTIPAGAIYAEAQEPDGSVASDILFTVDVLKPSPLQPEGANLGTGSSDSPGGGPRHYVATPLPLGGTYRIIAWFGNNFSASEPITLTEANPDRKLVLPLRPGVPLQVQVLNPAGQPATNVDVDFTCLFDNHSFNLQPAFTDASGRFEYDKCEPSSGKFLLTLRGPGMRGVIMEADMKKLPLTFHMQAGEKISGQVLNKATGQPVPQAVVSASPADMHLIGKFPPEKTSTDDQGRFVLDTLSDGNYYINANLQSWGYGGTEARAGGKKDVVIRMVPYGTPQ